jgi:O-antigen ligase
VVIDARYLNQTLELMLGLKKLILLVTYGLVFLIVSSTVRRREIPAYLKLMLWCAVICSLEMIYEYRTHTNLFYTWTYKLLPSALFRVEVMSVSYDEIGRPTVVGPAQLGLEAVGMLTMALPIALVGILQSKRARDRILYGLATVLLMAAAISTYRKSAFIAPLAVGATIAYFRRNELLKLAPIGVVGLLAIHALSPGALGSVTKQLHSNNLHVDTVSDRTTDYDAVRPDFWSHFALGRGFGTYDHTSYRILDSEVLLRIVETGLIGLISYLLMSILIVAVARKTIRSRHPDWAPIALIGAAAAVGFAMLSSLYDVLSFPHPPYLVLCLAGMVAALVKPGAEEEAVP